MANFAGLDLGSRALKSVYLNRAKEGYVLSGISYQELPFAEEEVPREEFLTGELKRLVKEGGLKVKDVAVGLSGEFTNVRPVEMAKMTREELVNVLPYEIEQYLPINPEESVVDFQLLGDSKADNTKMNVLLAAGRLEAAESINILFQMFEL